MAYFRVSISPADDLVAEKIIYLSLGDWYHLPFSDQMIHWMNDISAE